MNINTEENEDESTNQEPLKKDAALEEERLQVSQLPEGNTTIEDTDTTEDTTEPDSRYSEDDPRYSGGDSDNDSYDPDNSDFDGSDGGTSSSDSDLLSAGDGGDTLEETPDEGDTLEETPDEENDAPFKSSISGPPDLINSRIKGFESDGVRYKRISVTKVLHD